MATRYSLFDSPLFLGFDQFEETLEQLQKTSNNGYPPYNIEQVSETDLRISIAVAGFDMSDLTVEIENNQLTIKGKRQDQEERIYLHRGIATRQFQKSFILADGIEVEGASMDKGLLNIDLVRVIPQSQAKTIEITQTKESQKTAKQNIIDVTE